MEPKFVNPSLEGTKISDELASKVSNIDSNVTNLNSSVSSLNDNLTEVLGRIYNKVDELNSKISELMNVKPVENTNTNSVDIPVVSNETREVEVKPEVTESVAVEPQIEIPTVSEEVVAAPQIELPTISAEEPVAAPEV